MAAGQFLVVYQSYDYMRDMNLRFVWLDFFVCGIFLCLFYVSRKTWGNLLFKLNGIGSHEEYRHCYDRII